MADIEIAKLNPVDRPAWEELFVHASTTSPDVCYLQDLFTAPDARGQGVGGALIAAVVRWARIQRCGKVYWSTHETNATARRLYDQVGEYLGFIRYEIKL